MENDSKPKEMVKAEDDFKEYQLSKNKKKEETQNATITYEEYTDKADEEFEKEVFEDT